MVKITVRAPVNHPWNGLEVEVIDQSPSRIATFIGTFQKLDGKWRHVVDADVTIYFPDAITALRTAVSHIEHMAKFIAAQNAGYSFEGLGEDMPDIRAAMDVLSIDTGILASMTDFQSAVRDWCVECFGQTTADDASERNWRFFEEAIELVQSLGCTADDAHRLVDYVFERPAGEPHQEVGGTMVTLAALLAANGLSMAAGAADELARISSPETMNRIRGKHARKPHKSPLPGDYRHAEGER